MLVSSDIVEGKQFSMYIYFFILI